jgi:hypothetical protein
MSALRCLPAMVSALMTIVVRRYLGRNLMRGAEGKTMRKGCPFELLSGEQRDARQFETHEEALQIFVL